MPTEPVKPVGTSPSGFLLSVLRVLWFVDPRAAGKRRRHRCLVDEALGMGCVGGIEDPGSLLTDLDGGAEVDRGGGVQADPGMAVVMVVVLEEGVGEGPGVG